MEKKNMKFVAVTDLFYLSGASYEIAERFKWLIDSQLISPSDIKLITVKYVTSKNNISGGPVRIYFSNATAVYLNLPAGYRGNGPTDLCKVLELCEIDFNKEDILTPQEIVDLRYIKDEAYCYQFSLPDGSVEYSM